MLASNLKIGYRRSVVGSPINFSGSVLTRPAASVRHRERRRMHQVFVVYLVCSQGHPSIAGNFAQHLPYREGGVLLGGGGVMEGCGSLGRIGKSVLPGGRRSHGQRGTRTASTTSGENAGRTTMTSSTTGRRGYESFVGSRTTSPTTSSSRRWKSIGGRSASLQFEHGTEWLRLLPVNSASGYAHSELSLKNSYGDSSRCERQQ